MRAKKSRTIEDNFQEAHIYDKCEEIRLCLDTQAIMKASTQLRDTFSIGDICIAYISICRTLQITCIESSCKIANAKNIPSGLSIFQSKGDNIPDGYHYLRGPEARAECGGDQLDGDDGILCFRDVDAAQLERARYVRLPVRAVEQRHCAETLQF